MFRCARCGALVEMAGNESGGCKECGASFVSAVGHRFFERWDGKGISYMGAEWLLRNRSGDVYLRQDEGQRRNPHQELSEIIDAADDIFDLTTRARQFLGQLDFAPGSAWGNVVEAIEKLLAEIDGCAATANCCSVRVSSELPLKPKPEEGDEEWQN